jgi:hypothetical protein
MSDTQIALIKIVTRCLNYTKYEVIPDEDIDEPISCCIADLIMLRIRESSDQVKANYPTMIGILSEIV